MTGMDGSGRHYDEVNVGDAFRRSLTVTDTHLVVGAGLIGDFNPHHVDDAFASGTRFGTRILHGVMTSAIMGGAVGMIFHGTAVAYLEHATRFVAPVRAGDTLTRIAAAQLKDINRWKEIWDLNRDRVANENLSYPRLVLMMP